MSRDEGRKLGAKNQEGEKLSSAKNDGSANEAEEGGKVVAKEAIPAGLFKGTATKAKTETDNTSINAGERAKCCWSINIISIIRNLSIFIFFGQRWRWSCRGCFVDVYVSGTSILLEW